jgi:photosystem II stability/assembly factor-like uncharacterized protein
MKKLFLISFLNIILFSVNATTVTEEIAQQAATNFLSHYSKLKSTSIVFSNSKLTSNNGTAIYYTFSLQNGGWIIISADDAATPVLAYSTSGTFDQSKINPTAQLWLEGYSKEIYNAIQNNLANTFSHKEWQTLLNQEYTDAVKTVAPFTNTLWDQSQYYNDLCPASSYAPMGYGGHVPTGCVATTMAQIMKYYQYPAQGVGTSSYTHTAYGLLTANYGSTDYNWSAMPNNVVSHNAAVATLMYQCGIAVQMNYNPNGSGAQTESVPFALQTYFNYDNTMQEYSRDNVGNDDVWRGIIKKELDAKRPVYYAGSGTAGGHAFVCDGYDASNPTKFHFNWGWGGAENGYFSIGALNSSNGNFNNINRIIIGIKPRTTPGFIFRIDSPAELAQIDPGTTIPISIKAIKGTAKKVILYLDGMKKDSSLTDPFSFVLPASNLSAGQHILSIKASNDTAVNNHDLDILIKSSCWQPQTVPFSLDSVNVEQISAVNQDTVWAVLRDYSSKNRQIRKYIKTTNGGTTWTENTLNCATCGTMDLSNIFAFSASKAYACLNPGNNTGGVIMLTTDGGTTWTPQTTADFTNSWANWVYFFDANHGVCMGDSYRNRFFVFTTSNGGTTWTRATTNSLPSAITSEAGTVNFFDAIHDTIWFGTGNGRVFKSIDKGLNWTVKDGVLGNVQTNVRFKDGSHGFAFGGTTGFVIKKTSDGGNTWTEFTPDGALAGTDFEYIPQTDSTWINSGVNSAISYTNNSSLYWLDYLTYIRTTKFLSPSMGWGGGLYSQKSGGGMFKWVGNFTPKYNQDIVIRVKDLSNSPIPDASVVFNFQKKTTNMEGLANFTAKGYGNPESYLVSKTGYSNVAGNYIVDVKDTLDIQLAPSYSVTFDVTNQSDVVIPGATVIFNGLSQQTDAQGLVTFSNIPVGKSYPYAIVKTKYFAGYGTLDVINKSDTATIALIVDATPVKTLENDVKNVIFPNPATEFIQVLSEKPITSIEIYNLTGAKVYDKNVTGNTVQITLKDLVAGEYIIHVNNGNHQQSYKLSKTR